MPKTSGSGLASLNRRLKAIPEAVKAAVRPTLTKAGEDLARDMRQLAERSRDTGALIESIVVTPPGQSTPPYSQPGGEQVVPENAVMVTAGNTKVRYAHLVEYGTAKAAAAPFFWPAVRLNRKKIMGRIKRSISKAVKSAR